MKWQPWEDFKEVRPYNVAIEGPPCKDCAYWDPIIKYMGRHFDGVICCHAGEQFRDFSCYKEKSDANTTTNPRS